MAGADRGRSVARVRSKPEMGGIAVEQTGIITKEKQSPGGSSQNEDEKPGLRIAQVIAAALAEVTAASQEQVPYGNGIEPRRGPHPAVRQESRPATTTSASWSWTATTPAAFRTR